MNTKFLKKDIGRALELAKSAHDDTVELLTNPELDKTTRERGLAVVSSLAALTWLLGRIDEEVEA